MLGFFVKTIFCELKPQSQKGMGPRLFIHLSPTLTACREAICRTLCPVLKGWLLPGWIIGWITGWIIGASRMQKLPRLSTHSTVLLLRTTHCVQGLEDFSKCQTFVWASPSVKLPQHFLTHLPGSWMGIASNPSSATLSPVWFMFLSTPEHHGAKCEHRYVRIFMKTHRQ